MPSKNKLSREEISRTLSKGRRFHGQFVSVSFVPAAHFKCTAIVAKSVLKLAHDRALIKRRLREILRRSKPDQGSFVVTAKKACAAASFEELARDIEKVLTQILS